MSRGRLRVYLGMAPGVGKTFAMLDEGRRRLSRGTDVVVGIVETHGRRADRGAARRPRGRAAPAARVPRDDVRGDGPRRACWPAGPRSRWSTSSPTPTSPGPGNEKRWQDVDELLDAGIDVITTVNIQHLESLNDVVERITGVPQRETDPRRGGPRAPTRSRWSTSTPEALRRRMAHGNIYPPEQVDAALANYFRVGNLTALRELALLWLADRVDEGLQRYRAAARHRPSRGRPASGSSSRSPAAPRARRCIRRAARIAARTTGADLLAVHVVAQRRPGRRRPGRARPAAAPRASRWAARYHQVVGDDVAGRAARLRPGRERHPAGARRQPPRARSAPFLAGEGIGARGHARCRATSTSTSSPTRRRRGRGPAGPAGRGLTTSAAGAGCRAVALAAVLLPLLTLVLLAAARRPQPAQRHPAVPRRGRRWWRWSAGCWPGAGRRGRRQPAAQLLLHPAALHVHHRRAEQRAGPAGVRRGGGAGRRRRGRRASPGVRRRPARAARRGRRPWPALAGSVLRGETRCPRCSSGSARPSG